jgi:ribosomal protein S18 acetylase RimI-like enzyme
MSTENKLNRQTAIAVNIRLATFDDLDAMVQLHCACFTADDHIPMMLGKRYVKATYRWHIRSNHTYALVAEIEKKIVGLIGMSDTPFTASMFKACFWEFVLSIILSPSLIFKKKLWERLFRHSHQENKSQRRDLLNYPKVAQMTIGAVDREYRGLGIFDSLVESTIDISKSRGSIAIVAGVYKVNLSSRKVFQKSSWIETPSLETSDTVFYSFCLDESFHNEFQTLINN